MWTGPLSIVRGQLKKVERKHEFALVDKWLREMISEADEVGVQSFDKRANAPRVCCCS
jgi:hypothetical protein